MYVCLKLSVSQKFRCKSNLYKICRNSSNGKKLDTMNKFVNIVQVEHYEKYRSNVRLVSSVKIRQNMKHRSIIFESPIY